MYSKTALSILRYREELLNDCVTGCAAVNKEQIVVIESSICESPGIVDLLVEPDYRRDVVLPEVREVRLGGM